MSGSYIGLGRVIHQLEPVIRQVPALGFNYLADAVGTWFGQAGER
jgi:hypothetical protein